MDSIKRYAKENKICIVISHDSDLLSCCDCVYRLQDNTFKCVTEDSVKGEKDCVEREEINEFKVNAV